MTIACSKCGRVHTLPDGASDNKRVSFLCSQCGHRIVVDGRRNFVAGTAGMASFKENPICPSITSLLESTSSLFSFQSFLVSTLFSIVALLLLSIFSFVIVKNAPFFLSTRPLLAFLCGSVFILLMYGYGILLYLLAKIRYYKIDHPDKENVNWRYVLFDLPEDSVTLFVFFICVPFSILLVSLPVFFLGEGSILYSGFVLPLLIPITLFCIIIFSFFRFVPAAIAGKALYFRQTISSLKYFVIREALHIPVYSILVDMITFIVSLFILSFFWLAIIAVISVLGSFLDPSLSGHFRNIIQSGLSLFSGSLAVSDISFPVKAGMLLITFSLIVSVLLSFSFVITVRQTLIAQACWIMYTNPGRSIPKSALISIFVIGSFVLMSLFWLLPFLRLIFR